MICTKRKIIFNFEFYFTFFVHKKKKGKFLNYHCQTAQKVYRSKTKKNKSNNFRNGMQWSNIIL